MMMITISPRYSILSYPPQNYSSLTILSYPTLPACTLFISQPAFYYYLLILYHGLPSPLRSAGKKQKQYAKQKGLSNARPYVRATKHDLD